MVLRTLYLQHEDDASPVKGREIVLHGGGERIALFSDSQGRAQLDWTGDWVDRLEIDGEVVATDFSLGLKDSIDVRVKRVHKPGPGGRGHFVHLHYRDKMPVSKKEVDFYSRKGVCKKVQLDYDGKGWLDLEDDWIDRVEIDQQVVKRDWSLPSSDCDLELVVPKPGDQRDLDLEQLRYAEGGGKIGGVRGRLFFHDGTAVRSSYKVEIELRSATGVTYSTDTPGSYCQDDGTFYIATSEYDRDVVCKRIIVGKDTIPPDNWWMTADRYYVVLIPAGFGRGKGDKGGVIAGTVKTPGGTPLARMRINALIVSSGFGSSAPPEETFTDDSGHFALMFSGGVQLKYLYVNGQSPERILLGGQELDVRAIRPGSFGLELICQARLFGS